MADKKIGSHAAFEKAVSGAASVVTHLVRSGFDADLWAGDSKALDVSHYAATMERLALVQPDSAIDISAVAGRIRKQAGGGALVLVTGTADRDLLGVQQMLSSDYRSTFLMGVSTTTAQTLFGFHRLGVTTMTVRPDEKWAGAWMNAMRTSWNVESVR